MNAYSHTVKCGSVYVKVFNRSPPSAPYLLSFLPVLIVLTCFPALCHASDVPAVGPNPTAVSPEHQSLHTNEELRGGGDLEPALGCSLEEQRR